MRPCGWWDLLPWGNKTLGYVATSAQRHLTRLREGREESQRTSSLHLDILRDLKRVNAHIVSVAHPILDDADLLIESRLKRP